MILAELVANKFKGLLTGSEAWKALTGSQFVEHLAVMLGWAVEDANYKVERAMQEGFIDTALNRSSILAHGEGREYIPRRPSPATGRIRISNTGEQSITLLREREFQSDGSVTYTLENTVVIPANGVAEAAVSQRSKSVVEHCVAETKPFYEILINREVTPTVMGFEVWIDEKGKGEYVQWHYERLFTNSFEDSPAYDEFYHNTDQIGIRFGNGTFGKIPPAGALVSISVVHTEGDSLLLAGQHLYPMDVVAYADTSPASLDITVAETIQNGYPMEPTEEMRRNLHYWPVYNERLIWDNDYTYFLRRRYPEIVFVRAWGEEESEKMWGPKLEHINKIFISAYAPREGIEDDIMTAIADVPMMCRNFRWYDPEHVRFSLEVTGKTLNDKVLSEVEVDVRRALLSAYGMNATTRRDNVYLHEIYECIYSTGHFEKTSGAWFEVTVHGKSTAQYAYQMVSLDLDASCIKIEYL